MKSIEITATVRKSLGKKQSRALRSEKQVPCVLYGGKETLHFVAHENNFKDIIFTHHVYVVTLNIDGNTHLSILKELQFHPVSDKLLHIDFLEVSKDKPAKISIPVEITGTSVGVVEGGKMRQRKRYVKISGLVNDIPDSLVIDISELKIGQSILAGDLSFDKFEILEPKRAAIVSVISSRAASKGMGEEPVVPAAAAAAAAAAAPAEGAAAAPAEGAAPAAAAAPAKEKSKK